ncbi:synaptotagmin-like protein 2 isoform X2 [Rhinoraja longicauda]
MKTGSDLSKMMDLSFLSEEEQLELQKVLKRDGDLKKLEERRIRKLKNSNFEAKKLKVMTGEWFNDVKAKRYGEIASGIDILKNSFHRKKMPVVPDVAEKVSQNASVVLNSSPQHLDRSSQPETSEKRLTKEVEFTPETEMRIPKSKSQAPTDIRKVKDEAVTWEGDMAQAQRGRSNRDHQGKSTSPGTEGLLPISDALDTANDVPTSEPNPYSDFSPTGSLSAAQFWTAKEAPLHQSPHKGSPNLDVQNGKPLSRRAQPGFISDEADATKSAGLFKQIDDSARSPTAMDESGVAYSGVEIGQDPNKKSSSIGGLSKPEEAESNSKKNYPNAGISKKNLVSKSPTNLLSEILKGGNRPQKHDNDYTEKSNTKPLQNTAAESVVSQSTDSGSLFSRPSDSASAKVGRKSSASTWKDQHGDNNVGQHYEPENSTGLMSNLSSQIQKPGEYYNDVPNVTFGKAESENSKRKGILKRSPSTSSTESENLSKLISIQPAEDIGDMPQQTEDYSVNTKMEAGNKQVRFSTKKENKPNVVEGWKTDLNASKTTNEDRTTTQQEGNNGNNFSTASADGSYENNPAENLYLTNTGAAEHFLSPNLRDNTEALQRNVRGPSNDPSDLSVKINKPASANPVKVTVPLTPNDPYNEEYDYFDDITSESSFGSDILKQTDVQVNSNLNSSKLSGSLLSLYSDAGDFGDIPVQGAVRFKLQYEETKKEFQVQIMECQGLAAANIRKYTSDPYVKTYLFPDRSRASKRKTSVKKATLNPQYNEILKYKMRMQELQRRTLNLSVWHNDTLGRNVFLGETEVEMSNWDLRNNSLIWYDLHPKPSHLPEGNINEGEVHVALKYVPADATDGNKSLSGEVHIWLKGATKLQQLKPGGVDSFVRCYILPDTRKTSRQKTRVVKATFNPIYNHTMVYDGFRLDEIMEASAELSIWDHETFTNQFLGGVRLNLGTGISYGKNVDWMDSSEKEAAIWKDMISKPNEWVEAILPLRSTMTKRK